MVSFQIGQIDVKTGSDLYETIGGQQQRQFKDIEHSYLEHWASTHQVEAQFFTGKFYDGVNDADRQRLEEEGKVLVFTNGKNGYFTDPDTAKLMVHGDAERGISPLYADDQNSAHNNVAYGSLIASDGIASTSVADARILVIDDEQRSHGSEPLLDKQGQPVPQAQLEKLYDKMGDGTMLVTHATMRDLVTPEEQDSLTAKAFQKQGISTDIAGIGDDLSQVDTAMASVERQVDGLANRTVTQFRAATPDLPGMIKGTMASSQWCDRLGVDAIISSNDIKGDDGRLSSPGIKDVSQLWVNRKSDGQYGQQAVGPQVKGCIPEAILHEFNPRIEAQAKELAEVAGDPLQFKAYFLKRKDRQASHPMIQDELEDAPQEKSEWLYDTLKADRFDQLTGFQKVNKGLERYQKGQWQETALRGVNVPSAMAQHHSQLKPWEVCNKDLPHGSVVAYYRSPFPNVGAAAIAVNNTDAIQQQDREAFNKQGVAYLSPWTAKNIAITDFDRDANGFFEGYQATVPDLPQQLREQLAAAEQLPPEQQYEAGRAAIAELIQSHEQGQESRIAPAEYPVTVKEFVEKNAPDQKPPDIVKAKKVKHPWQEDESHSAATWRAWQITADNPTGKVANAGMTLQSLALELTHAPPEQQEALLRQVSTHFAKQLNKADAGKLSIPSDEWLQSQGFPKYQFKERMAEIAVTSRLLGNNSNPQVRQQFIQQNLQKASQLLSDAVNGPNAVNLQTAVDTAKSSRGIDQSTHQFVRALAYKKHELRQHQKDQNNYVNGQTMPTNTQEPIGWGVESVNAAYQEAKLPEQNHETYRAIFPKTATSGQEKEALGMAIDYNERIEQYQQAKNRLRENRPEDQQPTLNVTAASGRQLTIQNIKDDKGNLPVWRANGQQPDWEVSVQPNPRSRSEATQFAASLTFTDQASDRHTEALGYVAPESVNEHNLAQRLQQLPNQTLSIKNPHAQIQAPYAQQNDADEMLTRATSTAQRSVAQIPQEERPAYLSALWRSSKGMGFALKHFTPEISDRLQNVPDITLTGMQQSINEVGPIAPGEYTVRFSEYSYEKNGQTKTTPSIAIVGDDGSEQQFGAINARSPHLPLGTTVKAHLEMGESGKTAEMRVIDLVESPPNQSPHQEHPSAASTSHPPLQIVDSPAIEVPIAAEMTSTYQPQASSLQQQDFETPPENSQEVYAPSRQELRQWCAVAITNQDQPLTDKIIAKGQQLNATYQAETGDDGKPPMDYRNTSVVISNSDRQAMQNAIAAARETLQVGTQPIATAGTQKQLEVS